MSRKALIVVDMQNDFCPGGALAVPHGDDVIGPINALVDTYLANGDVVVYTKDHHPADHHSFKANHPDGIWPNHCVQQTGGWDFHPDLVVSGPTFYKAFLTTEDSYSGFGGHIKPDMAAPSLADYLKEQRVSNVTVVGLALDYCVKSTAIDAKGLGFDTAVLLSGTRPVNVNPTDGDAAIAELRAAGVSVK
ncbi:MAG: Nicotinamidase [Anaerolineae bacterium]|nr:Nicotinamidase [Anaerolineae bacterium]